MSVVSKVVEKISTRRRSRSQETRKKIDRIRRAITKKSRKWEGTRIIREMRDVR